MALAIETTAHGGDSGFNSAVTSAGLTTSVATILAAFVVITGGGGTTIVTDSGGHTWTKKGSTTVQSKPVELWGAVASAALSGVTVTATGQNGGQNINIDVYALSGSGTTLATAFGTPVSANGASGSPTLSVTTTADNSWVLGSVAQHETGTPTAGSNQTIDYNFVDNSGFAEGIHLKQNAVTPTSGTTVTMNATGFNSDWNMIAVEILAAAGGGGGGGSTFRGKALLGVGL